MTTTPQRSVPYALLERRLGLHDPVAVTGPVPTVQPMGTVAIDEAVILAGGQGIRLRPYTTLIPKPLVPIGNKYSILEIILRQLAAVGIRKVTLATGHLGEIIDAFVGNGERFGLDVRCVRDDVPVGTLGPVLGLLGALPERFLVMNADLLTDLDFADLTHSHLETDAPLTVAVCRREHRVEFGVLDIADRRIRRLEEKPSLSYAVNMGIYVVDRAALRDYPAGMSIGFDTLMLDLIDKGTPPAPYEFSGYWADIGRPEDYDRVNEEFAELEPLLLPRK